MNRRVPRLLLGIALVFVSLAASAASSQAGGQDGNFTGEQLAAFAKKVERTAAQRGARVFIVARIGRPESELPPGVHYTHTAFAVYSLIKTAKGRTIPGYVIHNLYQRDDKPNASHLVTDFPVDFFSGAQALRAGIIIPAPELQQRLLEVIGSDVYPKLHNPRYSAIANPYNTKFQNCTEYVLDVINAAVYGTSDLAIIKADTRAYFKAQPVKVNPFKLTLGSIFMPDVAMSDQGVTPETATFTTIASYLKTYHLEQAELTIMP